MLSIEQAPVYLKKTIKALWLCDTPCFWQAKFQDPGTACMEGLYLFNMQLYIVIICIVVFIAWLLKNILRGFIELSFSNSSLKNFTHSNDIEIVWTTIPALILASLASPSFSLLYSLDELASPELTLKIWGHQWYWSYEISDFNACSNTKNLKYSSYMLTDELLKADYAGFFRNLEVDKRVFMPTNTHLRLLITSVDVLHSWTIPSFGVKIDACPGRLNQANLFIKRVGIFFGQCSEICGVNHGFMPVVIMTYPSIEYYEIIAQNLNYT